MPDSTFVKRPSPKKRKSLIPEPIASAAKDIASGFGELKRQSGAAVENIKSGVEKIKRSVRK